jgi:signal transduction histidine kinase
MGLVDVGRALATAVSDDETPTAQEVGLRAIADQSAAALRVAERVAHGAATQEVFDAIADEVSALLGGASVAVVLIDDVRAAVVATCDADAPTGRRPPPATVVPITVGQRVRAALTTSSSTARPAAEVEACLERFAELAAAAISRADEHARLTDSRARVLARADDSRRQLQGHLHDGPQQRVVHALIALKLARAGVDAGSSTALLIDEALINVERAGRELRDVVDDILPRSLTHGGLRTGLESLVADLPVPVTLEVTGCRPPAATEITAYLLVAEALVNAVEHSGAGAATVTIHGAGDRLVLEIRDDGVGGADPTRGGGLTGLQDRVDIAAGSLTITSPPGHGTVIRAELPLPTGSGPDDVRRRGEL